MLSHFEQPIVANNTHWIRGVNLGGWLLMERYIAPYSFAVTDCHLRGDFCWYPGALGAPPNAPLCDSSCNPHRFENVFGEMDYPMDEYTLTQSFEDPKIAEDWLNTHFEYFVKKDDLIQLAESNLTHVRVPLAHWIFIEDPPYIAGKRWEYFQRLLQWCDELKLEVWPDIHTAPGSQNGFDNSGRQYALPTCRGWAGDPENVKKSLQVIEDLANAIKATEFSHVVTGFGLLNEPFKDCPRKIYLDFINKGLAMVRSILGSNVHVYVSDLFQAKSFNDGHFWVNEDRTYLDSHYYHVFAQHARALSPRQHIAFTCQAEHHARKSDSGSASCCFMDENNTIPTIGMKRLIGEWSVATDTLPVAKLKQVMDAVAETGAALDFDRQLSPARKSFLGQFSKAQMVSYEAADVGVGAGWFFWTLKMEGGVFAEWDLLRGLREGWIQVPSDRVASQQVFGSCYDILFETKDDMSIIHEYPPPTDDSDNWQGVNLDDDVVLSHGDSLLPPRRPWIWLPFGVVLVILVWLGRRRRQHGYQPVQNIQENGGR